MSIKDQPFFNDTKKEDKKEDKKEEKTERKEQKTLLKDKKKEGNTLAPSGKRLVKSISGQRMLGFKRRSVVFPQNVAVLITEAEFKSRTYQDNKDNFREVR
jgi:hypothetical protein